MGDALHGRVKGAIDSEIRDDDRRKAVTCCDVKFLDGRVGEDYLCLLIRPHRIAHIVASIECGEEDAEANQAACPSNEKRRRHLSNPGWRCVYGLTNIKLLSEHELERDVVRNRGLEDQ